MRFNCFRDELVAVLLGVKTIGDAITVGINDAQITIIEREIAIHHRTHIQGGEIGKEVDLAFEVDDDLLEPIQRAFRRFNGGRDHGEDLVALLS